jgi:hypothetical protein
MCLLGERTRLSLARRSSPADSKPSSLEYIYASEFSGSRSGSSQWDVDMEEERETWKGILAKFERVRGRDA